VELRYMGFDQDENRRAFKFDCVSKGGPTVRYIVMADMALFLKHHVGIQEGPALCARRLTSDLESLRDGEHVLSNDDLLAYTSARADAAARRAAIRRPVPRRRAASS
jgi:hypothetical protein